MATARGALNVTVEPEPPFLEQDGNKLSRNIVRKEFSGDMVGTSEAQNGGRLHRHPRLGRLRRHRALHRVGRGKGRVPWSFSTAGSWPRATPNSS